MNLKDPANNHNVCHHESTIFQNAIIMNVHPCPVSLFWAVSISNKQTLAGVNVRTFATVGVLRDRFALEGNLI